MPIDLFQRIKSVESSPEFEAELRGSYLCSAISFIQPEKDPESWELNYYNPKKHEIATIQILEEGANPKGADKPFKDAVPKKLDISKVSLKFQDAFGIAEAIRKEKYSQSVNRIFASLHAEDTVMWSINFILGSMQIVQVKIDALDGRIIESKLHTMMQKSGPAI